MESGAVGFERDVRPLFRQKDVDSMSSRFDLRSYDDVRQSAEQILARVADGSMPCDGRWSTDQVALFRAWIEGGCAA